MAMDFFARQDAARRHTGRLMVLFMVAVLLIITSVHFLVAGVMGGKFKDPKMILIDTAATLFVVLCGFGISHSQLSAGGGKVAESCGGRRIPPATRDPNERRLLNVVEEMSIASGVPVPPVYVMDDERGINAFAAGTYPGNAAVAVTRGALERLTRDELQGVIGHEFSHILNGDMRLNLKLANWLAGIMGLAVVGEVMVRLLLDSSDRSSRSSSRDDDDKDLRLVAAMFCIGVGLYIIGYVGVFFARMIQAAVSRQREFLADASAVQFTRNPEGLANALKKIAGSSLGSKIRNPQSKLLRHLYFSQSDETWIDFLFATHPKLQERIQLLDPSFDPASLEKVSEKPAPPVPAGKAALSYLDGGAGAQNFVERVGRPQAENLKQAQEYVSALSDTLKTAARDPHGASALVYGMLLSREPGLRAQQLQRLQTQVTEPVWYDLNQTLPKIAELQRAEKLPLLTLAIAGLRQLSRPDYEQFHASVQELVKSDGALDLFEFTLLKVLRRHLDGAFVSFEPPSTRYMGVIAVQTECVILLSCLARAGHPRSDTFATKAYQAGAQQLALRGATDQPLPVGMCSFEALDAALNKLNEASFALKKQILNACAAVVASDGEVRTEEAELLRAICDTLDCPVPPINVPSVG